MARAPHRLYGILAGARGLLGGALARPGAAEIEAALESGRLPILAGGTGLYLRPWRRGWPQPCPRCRRAVRAAAAGGHALSPRRRGVPREHWRSATRRPGAPGSSRRQPALDPRLGSARGHRPRAPTPGRPRPAATERPPTGFLRLVTAAAARAALRQLRPALRAMMEAGAPWRRCGGCWLQSLDPGLPVMKALGVPELAAHLGANAALEAGGDRRAAGKTRRYAKRQITWLRTRSAGNDQYAKRQFPPWAGETDEILADAAAKPRRPGAAIPFGHLGSLNAQYSESFPENLSDFAISC